MDKKLLSKNFFKDNPLDETSAAMFADFSLVMDFAEDQKLQEEIERLITPQLPNDRIAAIENTREVITAAQGAEEIVKLMRKELEMPNRTELRKLAVEKQEETVPLILKRFRTSGQDIFIENAMAVLSKSNRSYAEDLLRDYSSIRNAYAQSMACLVFGEQKIEEAIPLLLREYERFKKQYPDESFDQGPLLALYILYGKA